MNKTHNTCNSSREKGKFVKGKERLGEEHGQKEMVQRDDIWCIVNPIEELKLRTLNTFGLISNPNCIWI